MSTTLATRPDSSVHVTSIRDHFSYDTVDGMIARLMLDHNVDDDIAERMLDGALAFITLCGEDPEGFYPPSELVDHAWHLLILCTTEYEQLCDKLAGRFIHHTPTFLESDGAEPLSIESTISALAKYGLPIDQEVWSNGAELARCRRSPRPTPGGPSCGGGSNCSGSSCGGGGGGE